jgi:hypothetical protein
LVCHAEGREQTEGVIEYRIMRKYVDLRKEVTGGWRKLHNEQLQDLCKVSVNI